MEVPAGWEVLHTGDGVRTRAATLPAGADTDGEVRLQAADPDSGAALFVVRVPAPLRADRGTRDALAVAAPETLQRLWGVDFRVDWADAVELAGRPVVQLQGRLGLAGDRRIALLTLVPGPGLHHVVGLVAPEGDEGLPAEASAALATFRSPEASGALGLGLPSRSVLGATAGALFGLLLALGLRWARRRRAAE